jgi:hypothetical protein
VNGEIYAKAHLRGRFLKNAGGVVSVTELAELLEVSMDAVVLPEWIDRWARDVALPSTRAAAPSTWE